VGLSHLSRPPSALPPSPVPHLPLIPSCPKIKTQPNSFGLFWLYDEDSLPINDPDMENSLDEAGPFVMCENSSKFNEGITDASNPFYPYPNETSLLLGDWYWNQGHHKSQVGFKKLLNIIRDLEYHPEDVRNTNWTAINQKLGNSSIQDDKLGVIANGWMGIVDGRRQLFRYALPSIVVLGTLAQRNTLLRAFIITPWWISFARIYRTPLIDSSIMNPMNSTGSCLIRPRM